MAGCSRMTQVRRSDGIALQFSANAVDENAAEKAINVGMILSVAVIDPAPTSGVPNDDPCATDRTRVRRDDSALASHLFGRTSLARHVLQRGGVPPSRPAILWHRVLPSAVWGCR